MSESLEAEAEGSAEPDITVGASAAAIDIALRRSKGGRGEGGPDVTDRFLARQEELAAKQLHHLDEQFRHLRLKHFSERLKVTLQLLTVTVGSAVVLGLGWMAWDASRADGLVVEAFSVPPELAAQGASGPVVAREVLDSLRELDRGANSLIDVKTSDAFTEHTKIELPEAHLSITEVQKALRDWLGHETHLSGEVLKTAAGLKVVARTEAGETAVAEGPADALPALTSQVAEQIMSKARPNIVAEYYWRNKRLDDAKRLLTESLATSNDPLQISLSHLLLGNVEGDLGAVDSAVQHWREASTSPNRQLAAIALGDIGNREQLAGHTAAYRSLHRQAARLRANIPNAYLGRPSDLEASHEYKAAADDIRPMLYRHLRGTSGGGRTTYARELALMHDPNALKYIDQPTPIIQIGLENWAGFAQGWESYPNAQHQKESPYPRSYLLLADAELGRFAEADVIAASLPTDCVPCLAHRGVLAALEGDAALSEREFAAAVRLDPDEPSTYVWRGKMRLARRDVEGARADFAIAARLAPRWADPLEGWGEALLAKGDAAGAVAKFNAAFEFAPRWGRLHLKWGEALARLAKPAEARAHFAIAAGLGLTDPERAELTAQKP